MPERQSQMPHNKLPSHPSKLWNSHQSAQVSVHVTLCFLIICARAISHFLICVSSFLLLHLLPIKPGVLNCKECQIFLFLRLPQVHSTNRILRLVLQHIPAPR